MCIFYMHVWLCMHICTHMWMPVEARRQHWIPWSWSLRCLWAVHSGSWEPNLGPLEMHQVLFNCWAFSSATSTRFIDQETEVVRGKWLAGLQTSLFPSLGSSHLGRETDWNLICPQVECHDFENLWDRDLEKTGDRRLILTFPPSGDFLGLGLPVRSLGTSPKFCQSWGREDWNPLGAEAAAQLAMQPWQIKWLKSIN